MTRPDPSCQYCLGAGVRHNGYYEYPCTCVNRMDLLFMPSKRLEEIAEIMADLMFAYMNKDEDFPHQFEIEAMENGLYFLQEFYTNGKYTTGFFEEYINKMYPDED